MGFGPQANFLNETAASRRLAPRVARLHAAKPEYSTGTKKLLGAVAALSYAADSDVYAERKGLFVLRINEGVVTIQNSPDFRPKAF